MEGNKNCVSFEVDWFDPIAKIIQSMYLKFFMDNNTLELLQGSKFFLARIYYPEVVLEDLFIGNSIQIYNRRFEIKGYANSATKAFMESREKHFLCLLNKNAKDDGILGKFITVGTMNNLKLGKVKTTGSAFSAGLEKTLDVAAGDVLMELIGITSEDTSAFLKDASSLPGVTAMQINPTHLSDIFAACSPVKVPSSSTLCLIKPHILQSNGYTGTYSFKLDGSMVWDNKQKEKNRAGELISSITDAGFTIKAAATIHLSMGMSEQFFEVYRVVLPNYVSMIEQVSCGPLLALLIDKASPEMYAQVDTVTAFRALVGPYEPEIARALRSDSLRATYGVDFAKNAVHCTDLAEDGELECLHFFETLSAV